jgi:hypothetical protein
MGLSEIKTAVIADPRLDELLSESKVHVWLENSMHARCETFKIRDVKNKTRFM